jgi:hypothetical protein
MTVIAALYDPLVVFLADDLSDMGTPDDDSAHTPPVFEPHASKTGRG